MAGLGLSLPEGLSAQLLADQVPQGRTEPLATTIETAIDRSPWQLGPLRLTPVVVVDNAGYDNNVFSRPEGEPKVRIGRSPRGRAAGRSCRSDPNSS